MIWLLGSLAIAGNVSVEVESLEVNGQRVQELACSLQSGGLFASMAVVSAVAKQKEAFETCIPAGGAFVGTWTWNGPEVESTVKASSAPEANPCLQQALSAARSDLVGTCEALILVGAPAAADPAAAELKARQAEASPE